MLRGIERGLAVVDWAVATVLVVFAALVVLVGVVFGFWSYTERGTLGGFGAILVRGVAVAVVGALFTAAGLGMWQRAPWRWWIQLATVPAGVALWTAALCLTGTAVLAGSLRLCGP